MNILFHKTETTQDEIDAVVDTLHSGWLTMGPKTLAFEEAFKHYVGAPYSVSMNSATAALHLALKAIGLKAGDEVIVPTMTFIATAEVVTYFDAIPVLCDVEEDTHNIDVSKIESRITNKTKAIIPVHFAGQPCDMDALFSLAKKYNLKIIEDAAHAIPSSYKGVKIGALQSDVTCFSFYATKTLSTGEGGMATTHNETYEKSMKINRLHGISKDVWDRYSGGGWYYEVVDNGNKYNTTDLNAALGLVQLEKIERMCADREAIAKRYDTAFSTTAITPLQRKADRTTSYHLYVIKVNNRDELYNKLKEVGIGSSVHFIPVHKHPYYEKKYNYKQEDYPVANKLFEQSLSLPIYTSLCVEEQNYIIQKVLEFAK